MDTIVVTFGNEQRVFPWCENRISQVEVTFANTQEEQAVSSNEEAKG